ncbi:hypothetical protein [Paenibacillus xylanexedens]|uniref:hypothetical protein n=1 Tax=Paenibacillus xylanexedens TaxID=528191 RepID=UPI00119EC6FB|nr:hypothetical protein [Paenibacillus xylanexedens]
MKAIKRINKPYLIFLIWNVLMVFAVDGMTIKHEMGKGVSGNGNLGILALFPSVLTFLILCFWTAYVTKWWFYDQREYWGKWGNAAVSIVAAALCVLSVFWEIYIFEDLRVQLNGYTHDPESAVYRFGWLNQYTNTLYYNFPILLFGVSFAVIIGWVLEQVHRLRTNSKA